VPATSDSEYRAIVDLLPHRYPFLLIDRVLEFVDGERLVGLKSVSVNEPYFQGHFPGNPVMPGVLICEALAQAGALLAHRSSSGVPPGSTLFLTGLDQFRFRRIVVPGDQMRLAATIIRRRSPVWKIRGEASVDGQLVAEGEITAVERPLQS
jgi:3-hydroxyacyl-[acyl-carrier-protein] dehydratase